MFSSIYSATVTPVQLLIMAAAVAGGVWGLLYWLKPDWLPALVVSHALWDAAVFVVFPIM